LAIAASLLFVACGGHGDHGNGDADASEQDGGEAGRVCTPEMLASIDKYCPALMSTAHFMGLLDFACAGTTATAPDRHAKASTFCKSYKAGDEQDAAIDSSGAGFYCVCMVA